MAKAKYEGLFCRMPFDECIVSATGEVMLCCTAWLPMSIGNVHEQPLDEIWNSPWAQKIRASILDGTYRYCIESNCPHLQGQAGPMYKADEIPHEGLRKIAHEGQTVLDSGPRRIYIGYDPTCNLACPSCRCEYTVAKKESFAQAQYLHQSVYTSAALRGAEHVWISCNGDPFSSRIYREWLRNWDGARFPKLKIELLTNGLLLTESMWESIAASHEAITQVQVSVNAASRETFEEIQEGGSFEKLMENLEFLARLRREGAFEFFLLSFIVQKRNFREMKDFVRLGKRLGADGVCFTSIINWGTFDAEDFEDRDVHREGHPDFEELKEILTDPMFSDPMVELGSLNYLHPEFASLKAPPLPAAAARYTFEMLVDDVMLSPRQQGVVRKMIDTCKDNISDAMFLPNAEGVSPAGVLLEAARQGLSDAEKDARFRAFTEAEVEPSSGTTYSALVGRIATESQVAILAELDSQQQLAADLTAPKPLMEVDTGHEPFSERLAQAERGVADAVAPNSWRAVRERLALDDTQADAVLALLDQFKEAFAALTQRSTVTGGPSPLAHFANAARAGDPDAPKVFLSQLSAQTPSGARGTYVAELQTLELACRQRIVGLLRPHQQQALGTLPVNSLQDIDTGKDPMGAALSALMQGDSAQEKTAAPLRRPVGAVTTWEGLRVALALGPRQAEAALGLLRELQRSCSARGTELDGAEALAMEEATAQAITRELLRVQVLLLHEMPPGTLLRLALPLP